MLKRLLLVLAIAAAVFATFAAAASAKTLYVHVMWADWVYTTGAQVSCSSSAGTGVANVDSNGTATCYFGENPGQIYVYATVTPNCFIYNSQGQYNSFGSSEVLYLAEVMQYSTRWC